MRRAAIVALLLAGCGGWSEPVSVLSPAQTSPRLEPEAITAHGQIAGNATSSIIVQIENRYVPMMIRPDTVLSVGEVAVGPRAVQPGSDVRVTYIPGENANVALRVDVTADPSGWSAPPTESWEQPAP